VTTARISEAEEQLESVSCSSPTFCVVVGASDVWTSGNPTGGAEAWSSHKVTENGFQAKGGSVACPSTSLCAIAPGPTLEHEGHLVAHVFVSTNPTGEASAWKDTTEIDSFENAVFGVSCASDSFCVATTNLGDVVTSVSPAGGRAAWSPQNVDGSNKLYAV
jgi:hypothetical protein